MYPPELVIPMEKELTDHGVEAVKTAEEVEKIIKSPGTVMVVVNSVCGCAAANARPGVILALEHENKPDRVITVFAGVDREATAKAREFMLPFPPSSPSIAIFKDGELVFMMERHHIEGASAHEIADVLKKAFDQLATSANTSQS